MITHPFKSLVKVLLLLVNLTRTCSFIPTGIPNFFLLNQPKPITHYFLSKDDNYESQMQAMQTSLQQSWNNTTMGLLPTFLPHAATTAADSILSAMQETQGNLYTIQLALPYLEITNGPVYDEAQMIEFGIELSRALNDKRSSGGILKQNKRVAILVRDEDVVQRVKPILESNGLESSAQEELDNEFYDDFADFQGMSDQILTSPPPLTETNNNHPIHSLYRLSSLLGDNQFTSGGSAITTATTLHDDISKSISTHAMPPSLAKDEDIILLLSPIDQVEFLGLQTLLMSQEESKTIILLNPKFPVNLYSAQPVYSVLPLIARAVDNTNGAHNPKIVVLLRYPHPWQVFVDGQVEGDTHGENGGGFELVETIERDKVGSMGPSPEWIATCVKSFMEMKLGYGI